jgi:Activator of Hsp90 ATPase, N-terminal
VIRQSADYATVRPAICTVNNGNISTFFFFFYCVGVKSVEGEAQIVMARGKKRFIYDFNVTLDIELIVEGGVTESGGDSVKGTYVRTYERKSPSCTQR